MDYDLAAEIRKGINIKRDDPILQYAVEKASTAINTFLNDAFEQGVTNLDAKLYALPTDIPETATNLDLLKAFANYYNIQSQTWNDMVLKALEADRATLDGGIVESALKDVTFIKEDVAYAFQKAAVGEVEIKVDKALKELDVKQLVVDGGVSANQYLKERLKTICDNFNVKLQIPSIKYSVSFSYIYNCAISIKFLRFSTRVPSIILFSILTISTKDTIRNRSY